MKVAIIDDSRLARQEMLHLLEAYPDITVSGEAANAREAETMIIQHRPDLIFLDIQMPGKDGFTFLESLDTVPQVIFVTAYDEYAMRAFDYNALDYLQKPVTPERLRKALDKYQPLLQPHQPERPMTEDQQVFVKDGEKCWFVALRDIRLFEICDNYTRIYFAEEKPMIPRTLNYMEKRLDSTAFFRANRQQIINLKWIEKVEPWFSGTIRIILKDGTTVEVSRRQSIRFKEIMSF